MYLLLLQYLGFNNIIIKVEVDMTYLIAVYFATALILILVVRLLLLFYRASGGYLSFMIFNKYKKFRGLEIKNEERYIKPDFLGNYSSWVRVTYPDGSTFDVKIEG